MTSIRAVMKSDLGIRLSGLRNMDFKEENQMLLRRLELYKEKAE